MNLGENWGIEHEQNFSPKRFPTLCVYIYINTRMVLHVFFCARNSEYPGFSNDFRTEVKDMFTFYDLMTCDDHPIDGDAWIDGSNYSDVTRPGPPKG